MIVWKEQDSKFLITCLSKPFTVFHTKSKRSNTRETVENDPDRLIKRIKLQILETYHKNLPYKTPEDWDDSFHRLGGGSGRRRSKSILSRMSWDQFLLEYDKIISEERSTNNGD